MGAGPKRRAGIEHHVDGIGIRHITPARTDPEPLTEAHRMKVFHPFALPVFIFDLLDPVTKTGAQQRMLRQFGGNRGHISFCIEQADNIGIAPQACFTRSGSYTGVSLVS